MQTTLSNSQLIADAVQRDPGDFSAVDVMGSLVNNQKFKEGYDEFSRGQQTPKSYVWEALSAVAEDVGQSLFTNVRDYIDNVTDIDVCKVNALRSMMHMVGLDYQLISRLGSYPVEVQSLVDLLSVKKRCLLDNQFIKNDFIQSMSAAGAVLSGAVPYEAEETDCPPDAVSSSVDVLKLSSDISGPSAEDVFAGYISSLYLTFLEDMLEMSGVGLCSTTRIADVLQLSDGYGSNETPADRYLYKKMQNNINTSFDVSKAVDAIEDGLISINKFTGPTLSLIVDEIKWRNSVPEDLSALDLTTRTTYYRKQKVIEYAKFIDNMSHNGDVVSNMMTYEYDPSYFVVSNDESVHYCISGIPETKPQPGHHVHIFEEDIEKTARALTQITQYICKLRESVRLQVRKIFMKGTENLLRFTVNQFLIDYIDYAKNIASDEDLEKYQKLLSAHNVDDVYVKEYWDFTEYMNLSAQTTQYALNSQLVNDRYFDQTFSNVDGTLVPKADNTFTNEQINKFYLDDLGLKNTLEDVKKSRQDLSSRFYDFLSAVFNVAANPSYYNKTTNEFGAVLTSNTVATQLLSEDLHEISSIYEFLSSLAEEMQFVFNGSSTVSSQLSSFTNAAYKHISSQVMADVSSTYNEYEPQVQELSTSLGTLKSELTTMLSSTYQNYFCKSKNSYSYDQDGTYRFPVYTAPSEDLFMLQLTAASAWIQGNCKTSAVMHAVEQLSSAYAVSKANVDALIDGLTGEMSGYVPLEAVELDNEMDSISSFLSARAQSRMEYLQNALENFRTQARELKSSYDQAEASFSNVLASMPDTSQGWYMSSTAKGSGSYEMRKQGKTLSSGDGGDVIYDAYSQAYYKPADKGQGAWSRVYFDSTNDIDPTADLSARIDAAVGRVGEIGNIFFGTAQTASGKTASTPMTHGTSKDALMTIKASVVQIAAQYSSIIDQVCKLYNIPSSDFQMENAVNDQLKNKTDIVSKIINLNDYLGIKISDAQFSQDTVIKTYNEALAEVSQTSAQYIPEKNEYESLWTLFEEFFADFPKTSDYKAYIPSNLSAIDAYTVKKDNIALNSINEQFGSLSARYDQQLSSFESRFNAGLSVHTAPSEDSFVRYSYSGTYLENCLSNAEKSLSDDVTYRTLIANDKLNERMNEIDEKTRRVYSWSPATASKMQGLWWRYFPNEIDTSGSSSKKNAFLMQTKSFLDIVKQILDKINYTENSEYQSSKMLFQNYTGVPWVATDPYYNHKNMTHPSYQIHPFLWNFVESTAVDKTLQMLAEAESKFNYRDLDMAFINSKIDGYIGKFGQLIDVWKNHVEDFTGYQTTYERSSHVCGYTGEYSEVVDYDGAFYPPALEDFITSDGHLSSMSTWYTHLKISQSSEAAEFIDRALMNAHDDAADIAKLRDSSHQYDIYKYFEDAYKNIYVLYKKTDSSMTQWQKLHTPGELWIRLADSPIAMHVEDVLSETSQKLLQSLQMIPSMQDDGTKVQPQRPICDMEMMDNGKKIIFTCSSPYRTDGKTYMVLQSKSMYMYYDLLTGTGIGRLSLLDTDKDGSVFQTNQFPLNKDQSLAEDGTILDYVGSYARSALLVDVVYMQSKHILDDETQTTKTVEIPDRPLFRIYTVDFEHPVEDSMEVRLAYVHDAVGELPAIAHYEADEQRQRLDIAFAASCDAAEMSSFSSQKVNIQEDCEGATFYDPLSRDMNSLDVFNECLDIYSVDLGSKTVSSSKSQHQSNTDMGYTPSYAYGPNENILSAREDMFTAIELLGKSKDLSYLDGRVNANPDPYVTKYDIFNSLFGRAWETDLSAAVANDRSLFMHLCPSMYNGMPNQHIDGCFIGQYAGAYVWDVILKDNPSYSKLWRMKLLMYSTDTFGKNPYIVEDLSNAIISSRLLDDGEFLDAKYDSYDDGHASGCRVSTDDYDIVVAGTTNGIDQIDYSSMNTLPNIADIKYKFMDNNGAKYIQVKFQTKSQSIDSFIESGTVRLALVDEQDLAMLEMLHVMYPETSFNDLSAVTGEDLKNLHLSDYTALSNVEVHGVRIFDTTERFSFKADEEDAPAMLTAVDRYSIGPNTAYPMTIGQFYKKMMIDYNAKQNGKPIEFIYDIDNVYVMKAGDREVAEALSAVDIGANAFDTADEIRVYEDYWHEDGAGTLNSEKFAHDNPKFYQYVAFSDNGSDIDAAPEGFTIPSEYVESIKVTDDDVFSRYVENDLCLDGQKSDFNRDSQTADMFDCTQYMSFIYDELSDKDKAEVEEQVRRMLNLYVSFQRDDDGITLFFNYQNFVSSPFLKIEDGRPLVDTIPSTYAKLKTGQSASLDVIIQLRQCIGRKIVGVQNVVVAQYSIVNISDDKPKFLLKKTSDGKQPKSKSSASTSIAVIGQQVQNAVLGEDIEFTLTMSVNSSIEGTVECLLRYPHQTLRFMSGDSRVEKQAAGLLKCTFTAMQPVDTIVFKPTALPQNDMLRNDLKIEQMSSTLKNAKIEAFNGWIQCAPLQ